MNLLIIGAPGSGKGTMSDLIVKHYGIPHISTGDMLRAALKANSPVGLKAQSYMRAGLLVPDEIIQEVIVERFKKPDLTDGFLLDGYPRSLNQAYGLAEIMQDLKRKIDLVLNLKLAEESIYTRITGRRVCPKCAAIYHIKSKPSKVDGICDVCGSKLLQRRDDTAESLKTRLKAYHETTAPVLDYYRQAGCVVDIDADQPIEAVFAAIKEALGRLK